MINAIESSIIVEPLPQESRAVHKSNELSLKFFSESTMPASVPGIGHVSIAAIQKLPQTPKNHLAKPKM